jgi:putative endonuclease
MLALLSRIFPWSPRPLALGPSGEDLAARFLQRCKIRILVRNYRAAGAEIDLVALDDDVLVFVEVKTRRSEEISAPEAQVDRRKQYQITRAAYQYLANYAKPPKARFDVVAIVWPEDGEPVIRHHKAAFQAAF